MPTRSTLSDALNLRDWRIYHALAMRLITRVRELYAKESLDIDHDATTHRPVPVRLGAVPQD